MGFSYASEEPYTWKGFLQIDHTSSPFTTTILDKASLPSTSYAFTLDWFVLSLIVADAAAQTVKLQSDNGTPDIFLELPSDTIPLVGELAPLSRIPFGPESTSKKLALVMAANESLQIVSSSSGPKYFFRGYGRMIKP